MRPDVSIGIDRSWEATGASEVHDKNGMPFVDATPVTNSAYAPTRGFSPRAPPEDNIDTGLPEQNLAFMTGMPYENTHRAPTTTTQVPSVTHPEPIKKIKPIFFNGTIPPQPLSTNHFAPQPGSGSTYPIGSQPVNNVTRVVLNPQGPVSSNPPDGVADGGVWGQGPVAGAKTWSICTTVSVISCILILLPCGAFAFLCPCDTEALYKVNGKVYDTHGKYVGTERRVKFTPS